MKTFFVEHQGVASLIMIISFSFLLISLVVSSVSIQDHRKKKTTSICSYLIWSLSISLLLANVYYTVKNMVTGFHITDHIALAEYALVNTIICLFIFFLWFVKLLIVYFKREYVTVIDPLGRRIR